MPELGNELNQAQSVGVQPTQPSQASESSAPQPSSQEKDDGWGDAREAWDLEAEEKGKIPNDPNVAEDGQPGSHLEADQGTQQPEDQKEEAPKLSEDEIFKVDLNNIWETPVNSQNGGPQFLPHKYRNLANEKINAILADTKANTSKLVEGYKESSNGFARAFVNILQSENPVATLHEYVQEVVPALGLSPDIVSNLSKKLGGQVTENGNNNAETVQPKPNVSAGQVQQLINQELEKIENKYLGDLEKVEDAKGFRDILSKMQREMFSFQNKVQTVQLRNVLGSFYDKLVKPNFDELGTLKTEAENTKAVAEHRSKVSLWNDADTKLRGEFSDFAKYKPKIKELLKSRYNSARHQANAAGQGHYQVMKDLYLLVSRNDQLEAAKQPQRGAPGLKPTGTHIKTLKPGGSDWDDIKKELWGDVIS